MTALQGTQEITMTTPTVFIPRQTDEDTALSLAISALNLAHAEAPGVGRGGDGNARVAYAGGKVTGALKAYYASKGKGHDAAAQVNLAAARVRLETLNRRLRQYPSDRRDDADYLQFVLRDAADWAAKHHPTAARVEVTARY